MKDLAIVKIVPITLNRVIFQGNFPFYYRIFFLTLQVKMLLAFKEVLYGLPKVSSCLIRPAGQ